VLTIAFFQVFLDLIISGEPFQAAALWFCLERDDKIKKEGFEVVCESSKCLRIKIKN